MSENYEKLNIKEDIDNLKWAVDFLDELSVEDNLSENQSHQCTKASDKVYKQMTLLKLEFLKVEASGLELEYLEDVELLLRLSDKEE